MNEQELLYAALRAPLGIVTTGSHATAAKLKHVRRKLLPDDPALMELQIFGPDPSGHIFLLRTLAARGARDA